MWASPMSFRGRPVGNGAPGTSRPTRYAHGVRVRRAVCVCGHGAVRGRGRRPRRPARPWAFPMAFSWTSRGCGAPRTSRPTRCAHGVRVRTWRACAARRACADMARCVVGADVPGGPRARGRPRCRSVGNGAPRTSRPTRGRGVERGRGRRPRRPAYTWAFPMSSRGRGAPRTSRPIRCAHGARSTRAALGAGRPTEARRAPALTLPARFSRLRANKGREMPSLGGAWRY